MTIYSATKEVNPTFKFDGSKYTLLNKGRFNNLIGIKFNGSVITTWWKVLESKKMLNNNFGIIELNENDVLQVNNLKEHLRNEMINILKNQKTIMWA